MAPAAQGSLSRRAGRGDQRCPAALPALGDRGDRQDPAGRQRRGAVRPGGVLAGSQQRGRSPPPPAPRKSVPQGRPRQVRLSRRGGRRGLGARGHQHGLGDRHRHEHPWDRLCQRSRGGRGGLGYPARGEDGVSANGGGFATFPPASRPRAGLRGSSRAAAPSENPLFTLSPRVCSARGPSAAWPRRGASSIPRAPEPGGEESQLPPVNPSCSWQPLDSHVRAGWSHAAGGAGESGGSLGKERRKPAQAPHWDPPSRPLPRSPTPPLLTGGP